jgi:Mitochondrial carrier protein
MVDVCAGWISGAVTIVTLQPLDTILTRWQAHSVLPTGTTTPAATATAAPLSSIHVPQPPLLPSTTSIATQRAASMYTSTIPLPNVTATTGSPSYHAAALSNHWRVQTHHLVSSHGCRALWRGAGPMLAVVPLQNGLLMAGYGYGSRWMEPPTSHTGTTGCTTSDTQRQTQLAAIFVGGCTGGTNLESVTPIAV